MKLKPLLLVAGLTLLGSLPAFSEVSKPGTVVTEHLLSESLKETRTGLDPNRSILVYLPPGHREGSRAYPVIYYFHSLYSSNTRLFADGSVQRTLDRAIADGVVKEFILVAADYSTPTAGSFFENSSTSGHWLDFTVKELVPFVDRHFRTVPQRESRGLAGDFMGGYGALKFAMLYPEMFSVVYALHPVGTGTGVVPMRDRAEWRRMLEARSFHDLDGSAYSPVFLAMAQAYLPNPNRPPFYCDFMVELEGNDLKSNIENSVKLQTGFILDHFPPEIMGNLRKMRGVKFDWARYDPNPDHVFANRAFTIKLDDLGVEHEAEEYRGAPGATNWTEYGRVYCEMLPFFNRHLLFQKAD